MSNDELSQWRELPIEMWPVPALWAEIRRLYVENAAMHETLGECATEIAHSMLESGLTLMTLPAKDARLALANISERIEVSIHPGAIS